jgi:NAD(P)-dependent dehydrogenase (short-subunit alcohol dehydrogenase family)
MLGKIALVTGGTRGIGEAIAMELCNLGAEVIITGTKKNFICPHPYKYYCVDFNSNKSIEDFIHKISFLKIDILVNNAGINEIGPFLSVNFDSFEKIQRVNVFAPFLLCQTVLPKMIEAGWGRIINISSIWGIKSKAFRASYSASKFAIDGLTAAISAEVASEGILINSVSPGFIDTEMTQKVLNKHEILDLLESVPLKRLGTPKEIGVFVAWLASNENTYISGQNIAIDGGFTRV